MPEPKEGTVSVGQVTQQVIERLQGRAASVTAAMSEASRISTDLQDQLRQLLSYCEDQAQHSGYALEESAYRDVADKLRAILDGE
jgi:hypothetical protein